MRCVLFEIHLITGVQSNLYLLPGVRLMAKALATCTNPSSMVKTPACDKSQIINESPAENIERSRGE